MEALPTLAALHLTTAIVFLTIAIPLKTHGRWMTIGWLVEGAVLLWVSRRVIDAAEGLCADLRQFLGLGALLIVNPPAATRPIFNERFGTYCVAIAVCAFIAWLARRSHDEHEPNPLMHWPNLAAVAVLAVNLLILIAFSLGDSQLLVVPAHARMTVPILDDARLLDGRGIFVFGIFHVVWRGAVYDWLCQTLRFPALAGADPSLRPPSPRCFLWI